LVGWLVGWLNNQRESVTPWLYNSVWLYSWF